MGENGAKISININRPQNKGEFINGVFYPYPNPYATIHQVNKNIHVNSFPCQVVHMHSPKSPVKNHFRTTDFKKSIQNLSEEQKIIVDVMQKAMESCFSSIEVALANMEQRIGTIEAHIKNQDSFIAQTGAYISQIDFQINSLKRDFSQIEKRNEENVKDLNKRIGENLHLSIFYPFMQFYERKFGNKIKLESFRLSQLNHGKMFHPIKTVNSSKKYKKLLQFLDKNQTGFKTYTGYKKFSQIFAFNTDAINYDILGMNNGTIEAIVKISSTGLAPVNWNLYNFPKLKSEQLALIKRICQLERQLSYIIDISTIKFVGLFVFGKFFDVKMKSFFSSNKKMFPIVEKMYKEDKLFIGKFGHAFKVKTFQ